MASTTKSNIDAVLGGVSTVIWPVRCFKGGVSVDLYAAPPAPVVPDFGALTKLIVGRLIDCGTANDDSIADAEVFVYNACRAAMLESTPEAAVGTAPAVNIGNMQNTLGWIACSDCMPEENSPVLVCSSSGVVQRAIYSREGDNWNDWHGEYDEVDISAFSHWMPLPAAPTPTKAVNDAPKK